MAEEPGIEPNQPAQLPEFVALFNFIVSSNKGVQDLVQCLHAWEALKRMNAMVHGRAQATLAESKGGI